MLGSPPNCKFVIKIFNINIKKRTSKYLYGRMVYGNLINTAQGFTSGWSAINSGHFSLKDFFEGVVLTGQASRESYTAGRSLDEFLGAEASQDIGKQFGTIAWDTAAMLVPAPLRRFFAVGNIVEAGKEALSGNWLDAGQNLLTAGFQFAGIKDIKQAGAKIAAKNPTLPEAAKGLANDVPRNLQLRVSLKQTPTPMQLKKAGEYGPNPLSRQDVVQQIRLSSQNIDANAGIVNQQIMNGTSNLIANTAQKAGSWWQKLATNFNAGRNPVANSSQIIIPGQPIPNPNAHIIIAHS